MLKSNTRSWMEIDLSRISHNVKEIEKLIPSTSKIMAIVKANGYGHGDVECSRELERIGIDFFGVSCVEEGVRLREGGIQSPILILGYTPPIQFSYLQKYDLIQTLVSLEYAQKLDAYAREHDVVIQAHAKVDTGMSRIGICAQQHVYQIEDIKALYRMTHVKVCGIFSHFSVSDCLDEENCNFTKQQIVLFDRVLQDLKKDGIDPGTTHLQNSYGILNYPDLQYDYVRPGLLWMGVTSDDAIPIRTNPQFLPIMQWKANVSLVKEIQEGVTVSYGRHFTAHGTTKVATLSVGYADGFPRIVSNKGACVLLHGKRVPIIGNICMDQMMVDISSLTEEVHEGDVATLIGSDGNAFLPVDELSRLAKTINNETLCWMSERVTRIYK